FRHLMNQAIARSRRNKATMAILNLDLDRFREMQSALGSDNTDKLLRQIADRLKRICREGDTFARCDEDEFLWCVSNINKIEDVAVVAEKALEAVGRPITIGEKDHVLT